MAAAVGAGAAVVGVGAQLLGGSQGNQGTATQGTTTPQVPSWLLPYLQQNAATANTLASQPYQPYTGQQVNPLTAMQNQAGTMSQSLADNGAAITGMNAANAVQTNVANQGQNGLNPATIQSYMNPYTNSVIDATNLRAQQQEQLQQNQLQAQQGQTGAFGGSRASLAQGQLQSNFAQQQSQNNATMMQNNFTNAENMGMQGLGQANSAAQGMMQSTAGAQTAQLQNIGALQTAGGLQQTTGQNQDNAAYQDFLTQQAYPYQQLANSQNILNPIGSLTTGTNATGFTQQSGSPGLLQTALGSAAAGASIGNSLSGSNAFGFLNSSAPYNSSATDNSGIPSLSDAQASVADDTANVANGSISQGNLDFSQAEVSNIRDALATGGMVPHSRGYAQGGQVQQPSLSDHINHFIDTYAKHFANGGLIKSDKTDIPGVPTQYGMTQEEMPYTSQKPKYLIPAYAKGGQIPLQSGLSDANVPGIKRERQHWGKPYVPQTKNDPGYLRPDVKNALATGGMIGIPQFSNGGLTAHYGIPGFEEGGVAPDIGLIMGDADNGQSGIDAMFGDPTQAASSTNTMTTPGSIADETPEYAAWRAQQMQSSSPTLDKLSAWADQPSPLWNIGNGPAAPPNPTTGLNFNPGAGTKSGSDWSTPSGNSGGYGPAQGPATMGSVAHGDINSLANTVLNPQSTNAPGSANYAPDKDYVGKAEDAVSNLFKMFVPSGKVGDTSATAPTKDASEPTPQQHATDVAASGAAADILAAGGTEAQAKSAYIAKGGNPTTWADASASFAGDKTGTRAAAPVQRTSAIAPDAGQQTSSATGDIDNTINSGDTPQEKYEKYQNLMMNKILNGPGGPNSKVNLPLLSMGAAILGNRSNSLAGAIGAGGEAYTKTAQAQSAQNMELMQKMMMAHYYEGRNGIQQQRVDQNAPLVAAKINNLEQLPQGDPQKKQYDMAVQNGLKNGMSAQDAKAQAAAAFPDSLTTPNTSTSGQAAPAIGAIVDGHRFLGGDPSDPNSWAAQ